MTVSAVVYSRNEAKLLAPCLAALTGFDEVLVCDMQSTDDTVTVATHAGARVVPVPDARVIESVRQDGLDAASGEWVLFVDADEILPGGFSDHVRAMVDAAESDGTAGYRLRFANVAFGRTLRHTLVGSAKFALMRREATHYPSPGRAHVPPDFDGPTADAPPEVPPILHLNFRSPEQMVEKSLRYAPDVPGDPSLLRPLGLLRALVRATVFAGVWRDGTAGVAVATSSVVGAWYGALLEAERDDRLDRELPRSEQRAISAVSRAQRGLVLLRDRLHHRRSSRAEAVDTLP